MPQHGLALLKNSLTSTPENKAGNLTTTCSSLKQPARRSYALKNQRSRSQGNFNVNKKPLLLLPSHEPKCILDGLKLVTLTLLVSVLFKEWNSFPAFPLLYNSYNSYWFRFADTLYLRSSQAQSNSVEGRYWCRSCHLCVDYCTAGLIAKRLLIPFSIWSSADSFSVDANHLTRELQVWEQSSIV